MGERIGFKFEQPLRKPSYAATESTAVTVEQSAEPPNTDGAEHDAMMASENRQAREKAIEMANGALDLLSSTSADYSEYREWRVMSNALTALNLLKGEYHSQRLTIEEFEEYQKQISEKLNAYVKMIFDNRVARTIYLEETESRENAQSAD